MGQNQQTQAQEEELKLDSIQDLYRTFIMECPSGSLYLHEFKRMFGVHSGTPEAQYMDNIFRAFDMNNVSKLQESKMLPDFFIFYFRMTPYSSIKKTFSNLWGLNDSVSLFQDNKMDFLEYVAAVNLVLRGKLEDKLRWTFKVFDSDDNGRLDRNELQRIVKVKKELYKIKISFRSVS